MLSGPSPSSPALRLPDSALGARPNRLCPGPASISPSASMTSPSSWKSARPNPLLTLTVTLDVAARPSAVAVHVSSMACSTPVSAGAVQVVEVALGVPNAPPPLDDQEYLRRPPRARIPAASWFPVLKALGISPTSVDDPGDAVFNSQSSPPSLSNPYQLIPSVASPRGESHPAVRSPTLVDDAAVVTLSFQSSSPSSSSPYQLMPSVASPRGLPQPAVRSPTLVDDAAVVTLRLQSSSPLSSSAYQTVPSVAIPPTTPSPEGKSPCDARVRAGGSKLLSEPGTLGSVVARLAVVPSAESTP